MNEPLTKLLPLIVPLALAAPVTAGEIWVTNEKDDTVSVIDTDTLEVIQTYPTGERPRGITFSKGCTPMTSTSISPTKTTRSPRSSTRKPARLWPRST